MCANCENNVPTGSYPTSDADKVKAIRLAVNGGGQVAQLMEAATGSDEMTGGVAMATLAVVEDILNEKLELPEAGEGEEEGPFGGLVTSF